MSQTRPTILIVDDEVLSLETLTRNLDEEFEVRTATSAADAQGLLADEWVQVVISDQRMPEMSGVELLTRVRERWPDVVRMIISGYTDADDIIDSINRAGIYQFITNYYKAVASRAFVADGAQCLSTLSVAAGKRSDVA